MKNEKEKLTDDLFREGLNHHEAPFDPMAWTQMRELLDKDEELKPLLIVLDKPIKKKHSLLTILIIMSTLSILSITTLMMFNNNSQDQNLNHNSDTRKAGIEKGYESKTHNGKQETLNLNLKGDVSKAIGHEKNNNNKRLKSAIIDNGASILRPNLKVDVNATDENVTDKDMIEETSGTRNLNPDNNNTKLGSVDQALKVQTVENEPLDTFITTKIYGKYQKILVRKTWVPDEYKYVEIDSLKTVQSGFIGFHFTGQRPRGIDTMSAGFNFQFMSGNRIENAYWGLYGGLDFGMQFYGKSEKTNVALNNTRQDSGFTRLRSHSIDIFGRGHFEYAKFPIIPYVNIMGGPRFYSTNQQIKSYVKLEDTESGTSTNAHTSVSMMYGVGAGLRVRLSPVVSLDFRYELMSGTKVKQVDLEKSTFNGLSYNLAYRRSNPTVEQFKFGVLFDLSEKEYRKELVKPGHYVETIYDSLLVDPSDSNKIYLPCNCTPCDKSEYRTREQNPSVPYNNEEDEEDNNNSSGTRIRTNGGSGSGSGGKGSFPGIKPPAPKPAEKVPN